MFGATSLAGSCGNVRSPLFKAIFGSNNKGIFRVTVTCSGQYGYFLISSGIWNVPDLAAFWEALNFPKPTIMAVGGVWIFPWERAVQWSLCWTTEVTASWQVGQPWMADLIGWSGWICWGTEVGTTIQVRLATTLPKCQACTSWWTRSLRCLEYN